MKLQITLLAALGLSITSQAATVNLDTLGFGSANSQLANTTVTSDVVGTAAIGFSSTAVGAPTRTATYTITGFDFDGNGQNDTLIFDLVQADVQFGRNITHDETTGVGIDGNSSEAINFTETLEISFLNASVTLAGTANTATASLINFTDATTVITWMSPEISIDGVSQGAPGADTFTSSSPEFVRSNVNGAFRLTDVSLDVSVDVTAVPEPSSTVLLGLGGLALLARRRK